MTQWCACISLVAAVAIVALASPLLAKEAPRLPRPRPAPAAGIVVETWAEGLEARLRDAGAEADRQPEHAAAASASVAADPLQAIETLARTPKPRPDPALMALVDPRGQLELPMPLPAPAVPLESAADHAACLNRLRKLGVAFTEMAPISPGGACEVARPLMVTGVGDGVTIEPEAIMNCATAEVLAAWTAEVMAPAARHILDAVPTGIVHASTYVCRPRNNVPGAKLSEHARANAVDIASIAFAAREPLTVGDADASAAERRLEMAIRAGACNHFTTVLGPGSDAAHATHLHFDMAKRRNDYRLCDLDPAIASDAPNTKRE